MYFKVFLVRFCKIWRPHDWAGHLGLARHIWDYIEEGKRQSEALIGEGQKPLLARDRGPHCGGFPIITSVG